MSPWPVSRGGPVRGRATVPAQHPHGSPAARGALEPGDPAAAAGAHDPSVNTLGFCTMGANVFIVSASSPSRGGGVSSHPLPSQLHPHPGSIPIPLLGLAHPHPPKRSASDWNFPLCSPKLYPRADVSARGQSREGSSAGPIGRPDPHGQAERREPQTSIICIHRLHPAAGMGEGCGMGWR